MHLGCDYTVEEVGYNQLRLNPKEQLSAGDVGYIVAGIKSVREIEIGDTITHRDRQAAEPVPGYKKARQVVFSSIYPMNTDEYKDLSKALEKLAINDAALTYRKRQFRGPGLRISLRLSRPAAPRRDPGAPAAGIRHRAGHLGPLGEVQGDLEGRP